MVLVFRRPGADVDASRAVRKLGARGRLRLLVEFGMTPSLRARLQALLNGPKDDLGDFLDEAS
jgi:hypothetical protein